MRGAMSINCLGMRGEKLGRFSAPSLAPPQRGHKFFKPVKKKILRLPWYELFSNLHSYDHCVSCMLWGLNFHNLAPLEKKWSAPIRGYLCEVTQSVQGVQDSHSKGVIIKRWELLFSLLNVWWKPLIMRFEDLVQASEVSSVINY